MVYTTEIRDLPEKKGSGLITSKLKTKLINSLGIQIEEFLTDDVGIFGFITNKGIFVGKKYVYGNLVSCHKRAVVSAYNLKKDLIMYISDTDKFYTFYPWELLKKGEENLKGKTKMLNFNIKLGRRFVL